MKKNEEKAELRKSMGFVLEQFMAEFPYRKSKKKIKVLYKAWLSTSSRKVSTKERAAMWLFFNELKQTLKTAHRISEPYAQNIKD